MQAKLRLIAQSSTSSPVIVCIPGGPGLSGDSFGDFPKKLSHLGCVYVLDPPGTGGNKLNETPTFDLVISSIESAINKLARDVVLVAHSYGGIYASELIRRNPAAYSGVVLMAAPLSTDSYQTAIVPFQKHMTPDLRAALEQFEANPTDSNFAESLSHYGSLYFYKELELGSKLLKQDLTSAVSFSALISVLSKNSLNRNFVASIADFKLPKMLIAGAQDLLLTPEVLIRDATRGGLEFLVVEDAGHFVMLDQPDTVARLIQQKFATGGSKR